MIDLTLCEDIPSRSAALYTVSTTTRSGTSKGDHMSLTGLKSKLAQHHREARQHRALERAIANAPTPASRQELQSLLLR
jgi:hypothetical protein